jgi:hypothetical protein
MTSRWTSDAVRLLIHRCRYLSLLVDSWQPARLGTDWIRMEEADMECGAGQSTFYAVRNTPYVRSRCITRLRLIFAYNTGGHTYNGRCGVRSIHASCSLNLDDSRLSRFLSSTFQPARRCWKSPASRVPISLRGTEEYMWVWNYGLFPQRIKCSDR